MLLLTLGTCYLSLLIVPQIIRFLNWVYAPQLACIEHEIAPHEAENELTERARKVAQ